MRNGYGLCLIVFKMFDVPIKNVQTNPVTLKEIHFNFEKFFISIEGIVDEI